jgi:hypothetical protein
MSAWEKMMAMYWPWGMDPFPRLSSKWNMASLSSVKTDARAATESHSYSDGSSNPMAAVLMKKNNNKVFPVENTMEEEVTLSKKKLKVKPFLVSKEALAYVNHVSQCESLNVFHYERTHHLLLHHSPPREFNSFRRHPRCRQRSLLSVISPPMSRIQRPTSFRFGHLI